MPQNKNIITCKNCGTEIEISEALTHQIEESLLADLKTQHKEEVDKIKKETEDKLRRKIAEEMELKLKDSEEETEELKEKNKELREQVLEMNKLMRELKDQQERIEIENQKKVTEEVEKAKEANLKLAEEKYLFQVKELEKKLGDTQKALADANTKAQQTSQQLQGEVLELDLEEKLRAAFIYDEISSVGKGVAGADVIQKVRNSFGKTAGMILWETKRAKWTPSWLPKLRDDSRKVGATIAILVCENVPKEIDTFSFMDGILVTSYPFAIPLAGILRRDIMQIAVAKSGAINTEEKLGNLYKYLQSDSFRHHFEAYAEGIVAMQQDLETEKRSTQRLWKKREMDITKMLGNITSMYGELQSIMGKTLPEIKILELPQSTESD